MFAERGFRATTVRDIADAAGILSGSLYHHFDSRSPWWTRS
ncbi:helix-turn-helix domain-containing protein [Kibdelosporangium philippinense]